MENQKIKQNGLNEAEENNPSTNKFWGLSLKGSHSQPDRIRSKYHHA